ncbi:WW domain-containing oxidoreductase-like [Mercenaria mercenaria]|uniref:WW domain-containing oxidoreductase-like n=1 Tax=Mercenaria mercenaria TaxID=6596 RepID=UPI00234F1DDE|nr:WW domain-containing oxidoreductase-like [Mercenaria mercenaria]
MGSRASFPVSEVRVIMVTDANCGLGYQIAKSAEMMGATVILACRSADKARAAMEKMHEEFKEEKTRGTPNLTEKSTLCLEFLKVDLGPFKSVAQFCEDFKKTGRLLHVLVCNAGIAPIPYMKSDDDLEMILTPIHGATCAIDLVVNPKHAGVFGLYWEDCKIKEPSRLSRDEEKQEAL